MEAKDTVMNDEQLEENIRKDYKDFRIKDEIGYVADILIWAREAQAEISFRAGEDQGYKNGSIDGYNEATRKAIKSCSEALQAGHKMGIKEVVEEMSYYSQALTLAELLETVQWQFKLKEWGIDEKVIHK